jgi:starch synthase (maltosyl-transferring)
VNVQTSVPLIYNLFPRHFPTVDDWAAVLPRVREMGFSAVFVNPFHETGFSGSLYSIKDYFRLNPLFLRKGRDPSDFTPLERFIDACREAGLDLIMDLVINHTAIDSPLVKMHPSWYKHDGSGNVASPFAVDPDDPGMVTVWGDLASIDNENSRDRENLWHYWDSLIAFYQKMGIMGFRCDAAYQVPPRLWKWLIDRAKKRYPGSFFLAETLGCRLDQVEALDGSGFDYLFNSVKWWNYDKSWALDQHAAHAHIAPSIGFAESHDTERLAGVSPGTRDAQKGRYAFAALFSKGLLMPMGFESGATTRIDVVRGTPADVDKPTWDIGKWIGAMNRFKLKIPVLAEEGLWRPLCDYALPFLFLEKSSSRGSRSVFLCINKQADASTVVDSDMVPPEVRACSRTVQIMGEPMVEEAGIPAVFLLEGSEIVLFM